MHMADALVSPAVGATMYVASGLMTAYSIKKLRKEEDLKKNIETIKIYVRGHNLYDIFYGRYRGDRETEILRKYIDAAPRDTFKDIFDAIDSFVYFENRKKTDVK